MRTFKLFLLFLAIAALLGTGTGLFLASRLAQRYTSSESGIITSMRVVMDPQSFFPDKNDLFILVLGTDYNYTEKDIMYTKGSRSDTMFLIHLNLKNKSMKFLSIPRDLRVYIPGDCIHGDCYDRINAAFAVGGPKLSETVVATLIGVPIDYYVRIKEQGLKNLVNAIGGIDLNVEKNMDYDDSWGHLHIHLKKGWQHLDGDKAAEYARFRHDEEGDYGRIRRQHQVIGAIAKRMLDPMVIPNLNNIVRVARMNVETNLIFPQILALANLFKKTNLSDLKLTTLPTVPKDIFEFGVWASYVLLDEQNAKNVIQDFISMRASRTAASGGIASERETQYISNSSDSPAQTGHPLSVEVLNGSGVPGLAQEVADKLRAGGFIVARVGNADRFDYAKTEIMDHTGKGEAGAVARLLDKTDAGTYSVPQEPRQVDVTVIVGRSR